MLPWLKTEQDEGERQDRQAAQRFVAIGNDFLQKPAAAGIPELARMPHALDPGAGLRVRSRFTFRDFIEVAQPASPLRWLGDVALGAIGARHVIAGEARNFLDELLEVNSARVQNDILNRVQESHGQLETEIRKLLHEVGRVAEQALTDAKAQRQKGALAVEGYLQFLDAFERMAVECLGASDASVLPART